MGEGHFSLDPLGSSNFRASKQLKTAKNGLFWQFLPIWHSVDQKSLTIYWGRYFKSRSCWIQPYFGLKTAQNGPKWPNLVVLPISHSVDHFFDKNNYKYKGEGHFSLDPLGSNNVRASKQLKTGQNGLFWQFSPIWHSVDQFFVWNQLDLTQKSLTICKGGVYFKIRSSWIQPYFNFKQLKKKKMPFFWQFLPIWHSGDQFFD